MFVPQAINEAPPTSLSDCCHCVFVSCDTDRRHNRAACVIVSVYLLTTFLATWMLHLRLCVCERTDQRWMYTNVSGCSSLCDCCFFVFLLFLFEHSCTLSELIVFIFFFWLFVVATLTSVASTKVCGKNQKTKKKSPSRPFVLDGTEEEFGSKTDVIFSAFS